MSEQYTKEELKKCLGSWRWRLEHLYHIVDKSGKDVQFIPNRAQRKFLDNLGHRNLVLKGRQIGLTTCWALIQLDQAIFRDNTRTVIQAQDKGTASALFRNTIVYAWEHMPPVVLKGRHTISDSKTMLEFNNGSCIEVTSSARGQTPFMLHISELGKTAARYPGKAREVMTGSITGLPKDGWGCIESTAEGKGGVFADLVLEAIKRVEAGHIPCPLDWKFHFFSWFDMDEYSLEDSSEVVSPADDEYFATIEARNGITLSQGQRQWYCSIRRNNYGGDPQQMHQEFPSFAEEAFDQSTEGCWFTEQMKSIRKNGRITDVPWQRGYPVHTFWDIGRSDGTGIWFFQHRDGQDNFIRYYEDWEQEWDVYVAAMQRFGYVFGTHFLPHDADHRRQVKTSGQANTAKKILEDLGLTNIVVVPRTPDKMVSINKARTKLPNVWFDKTNCADGIKHLDCYGKTWDTRHSCWLDIPDKSKGHSECADAWMQFSDGYSVEKTTNLVDISNMVTIQQTSPFMGGGWR
jgi:hypothetical protein